MSYVIEMLKKTLVQQEKSLLELERDINRLNREVEAAIQEFDRCAANVAAIRAQLKQELEESHE